MSGEIVDNYLKFFMYLSPNGSIHSAGGSGLSLSLREATRMKSALRFLFLFALIMAGGAASAHPLQRMKSETVIVCEASLDTDQPSFTETSCKPLNGKALSSYNKLIWVKGDINLPEDLVSSSEPLGIYVTGRAASAFFLNGTLVGANGVPSADAEGEVPGQIDKVLYLPKEIVRVGPNELIVKISTHKSLLKFEDPVHTLAVGHFGNRTDGILRGYVPAFLPLGILVAGAFYFGGLALGQKHGGQMLLVPLVALFVSIQLVLEVSRGLIAYSYPFHDLRMGLILLCAMASGICLLFHIVSRFVVEQRKKIGAILLAGCLIPTAFIRSFDGLTLAAIFMPALFGAVIAGYAGWRRKDKPAFSYVIVLLAFDLALLLGRSSFLDITYYYLVSALLLFLFAQQLQLLLEEKRLRAAEQSRADRLEFVLAESVQRAAPKTIPVKQTGRLKVVATETLAFCKAAGDYVELSLMGGECLLHNGSLAELEKELPATFLRVHRSYLVNTAIVEALERHSTGAGSLLLNTGDSVPVSRRILPKVRQVLG